MSFLGEIKRRKVFQVAAVYAVVAWLLVQIVDVVSGPLLLPDMFARIVILVLAIGFPIAVVLSWAFDITPEGVVRDEGESVSTQSGGRRIEHVLIGLLIAAVGWIGFRELNPPAVGIQDVLSNSIAVMPCDDFSPDPENAYFASGIHGEILRELVEVSGLNVIGRTSVLSYAGAARPFSEIAQELNVGYILNCSVSYAEGRVTIAVQLDSAETGFTVWAERYNEEFSDVFAIQADIASNIANELAAEFSLDEQPSEKPPTISDEAQFAYFRAISVWGGDSLSRSQFDFYIDQAINLARDFALAYATRAARHAYAFIGGGQLPGALSIIHEDALHALNLDNTLGLAHAALAMFHLASWQAAEAEQAFREAIRWSPNDSQILTMYGRFKRYRGEYTESIRLGQRAVQLDPRNDASHFQLGIGYRQVGDLDAAAASLRVALILADAPVTHLQLAHTEISRDNRAEALSELEKARNLFGENLTSTRLAQFAYAYSQLENSNDVNRLFSELKAQEEGEVQISGVTWAMMYIALGDYNQAFNWLERASEDVSLRDANDLLILGELAANPYRDPELDQSRFQEAFKRFWITE